MAKVVFWVVDGSGVLVAVSATVGVVSLGWFVGVAVSFFVGVGVFVPLGLGVGVLVTLGLAVGIGVLVDEDFGIQHMTGKPFGSPLEVPSVPHDLEVSPEVVVYRVFIPDGQTVLSVHTPTPFVPQAP